METGHVERTDEDTRVLSKPTLSVWDDENFVLFKPNVDYVLHEYEDYEEYVKVQTEAHDRKFHKVWTRTPNIQRLSKYLREHLESETLNGMCHGVRKGIEVHEFRKFLDTPYIYGTDIGSSTKTLPGVYVHDFHDLLVGFEPFDFVYSNSLDHAYDPEKALTNWVRSVKVGGLVIVDHTTDHEPKKSKYTDPFGVTYTTFLDLLGLWNTKNDDVSWRIKDTLDPVVIPDYMDHFKHIVLERTL